MGQAIWKGSVGFGLVNIPVTLYSASARADELRFTMLDRRDMSPIGYKKVSKSSGEEVPKEEQVKGFEVEEGRFVVLDDGDFKKAAPERAQRVDIFAFVGLEEIDPAFFSRPYYLEPAAKSDKVYALLRETLKRTRRAGIAKVVLRAREHLSALIAREGLLLLELLRYPEELRDPGELRLPETNLKKLKISETELKMAERLVSDLEAEWRPESYKDEYREQLLEFIRRKAETGKAEPVAIPKKPREEPPEDIMALLKQSVAKAETGKRAPAKGRYLH